MSYLLHFSALVRTEIEKKHIPKCIHFRSTFRKEGLYFKRMMLETINNMMLELYASMAQAELEKKEKRQREGIEAKKLRGEWDDYGRPSVMKQETFDENFQSVVSGETTPTQLRKNLGMTHSTFYRYRKTFYEKYPELSNSAN